MRLPSTQRLASATRARRARRGHLEHLDRRSVMSLFSGPPGRGTSTTSALADRDGLEAGAFMPVGRPRLEQENWRSWHIASMPSEPGCTGSWKKWALKNHSPGSTSFSARPRRGPSCRRSGRVPVTRSSMQSIGPGASARRRSTSRAGASRSMVEKSAGLDQRARSSSGWGRPDLVLEGRLREEPEDRLRSRRRALLADEALDVEDDDDHPARARDVRDLHRPCGGAGGGEELDRARWRCRRGCGRGGPRRW
jgi:hypothetical protein